MLPKNREPSYPGEILWEEFLLPLELTQTQFADHLGGSWTQAKLSAIINGKRAITEEIALDFADALGTSPQFWMNLQSNWNLWHVMKKRKKLKPLSLRKFRTKSKIKKI